MERLHVNCIRDLIHRIRLSQSDRAISRDLRISRVTVHKYRSLAEAHGYLDPAVPLPDTQTIAQALGPAPQPPRTISSVEPYRSVVIDLLDRGVEMMTIFDRLTQDHGYQGSYSSVRRFVHHLRPADRRATVRIHSDPGQEAQVDFGSAGMVLDPQTGHLRQAYVFVMTLGFSRHQYAELVFDQRIPTWLALHRRAFESFGGVPARVVPDNLKAAVLQASLHDPVLGEAYRRFAQHYEFLVSPTRPATPEHKGKVENGVHFVKRSFLAGQQFVDIREANQKLSTWVKERAGTREHGTTHQPPLALFESHERHSLLPLPADPFELTETRLVTVHHDCHVVIDGSYYSVPYHHIGQRLDAYIFERVIQLFSGATLVATHPRATNKGEWHTRSQHYPQDKAAFLERTPAYCRELARRVGPATFEIVDTLLSERPSDRLRSVQAILRLVETVGEKRLESACQRALFYGDGRYQRIKDILNATLDQQPLPDSRPEPVQPKLFAYQRSASEFFDSEGTAC